MARNATTPPGARTPTTSAINDVRGDLPADSPPRRGHLRLTRTPDQHPDQRSASRASRRTAS